MKRIDRHLITVHGDFLTREDQKILKDFHRFQESSSKARFCFTCARRVASIPNHKSRCNGKPEKIQKQHCLSLLPQSLKNKILQQNLDVAEDECLSLKEEKTLNYFLLQSRLNCRNQPVLDLTWEKLEEIKSKGSVLTSRHKTGKYYDVALRVEQDQTPLLEKLKKSYTREQTEISPFIFATRTGKKDRSMSKQIQEIFQQRFGDKPEKVKFNSNSIRKYREERMQQLRIDEQMAPVVLSEHLQQTGHTQQTAQKHYMAPNLENRNKLLDLLVNDLRTVEEDCEDEEAAPATVAQIEELTIGDATAVEIRQEREKEIERKNRGNIHFLFPITNPDRS